GGTRRQHREEALLGELLRERAADAPAGADRQRTVVERLAVRELGVAPIGLPLRGGANDNGDRLALGVLAGHGLCVPSASLRPILPRSGAGPNATIHPAARPTRSANSSR